MGHCSVPPAELFPFSTARRTPDGEVAFFLVTSWGHSGSIWLAGSLNLHGDVCATVGIDNPIECFTLYPMHKDAAAITAAAGDELSAFGFGDRDRPRFAEFRRSLESRGRTLPARDRDRLPFFVFDELALIPGRYAARGNVHGITLMQAAAAVRADAGVFRDRAVVVLDLVRHPVSRTESAINATLTYHMDALGPRIAAWLDEHAAECLDLERRYGIDCGDPRVQAVLHVHRQGMQNDLWAGEVRGYPDVEHLPLERLQCDPSYFAFVFSILTQGRCVADPAYLERVFSPSNLGAGRQSTADGARPAGPREQYEQWSPFERDEFAATCRRLDAAETYFPLGYDLSFVPA